MSSSAETDRDHVGKLCDSWATKGFKAHPNYSRDDSTIPSVWSSEKRGQDAVNPTVGEGVKEKDLIGASWKLAFALRDDGWWLRDCIIWHKPNPTPISVKDRTCPAHEYIFMLSKNSVYYYDNEAIEEPGNVKSYRGERRKKRSVWTVPVRGFAEAHFATFPPDLIKPCVLAGAPAGGSVLDPFGGAGTTGIVARELDRHCTLIELSPNYCEMTGDRLGADLLCAAIESAIRGS